MNGGRCLRRQRENVPPGSGRVSRTDDRELVRAYLHGREEQAFRVLYRRHSPALYRLLLRLAGGRPSEAEDLLQTAWIRAAERLECFRWESSLRSWLGGVAINCYREWLRREKRDGTLVPLEVLDSSPRARARREISALQTALTDAQVLAGEEDAETLRIVQNRLERTKEELGRDTANTLNDLESTWIDLDKMAGGQLAVEAE